jgi:hypothetical protein
MYQDGQFDDSRLAIIAQTAVERGPVFELY